MEFNELIDLLIELCKNEVSIKYSNFVQLVRKHTRRGDFSVSPSNYNGFYDNVKGVLLTLKDEDTMGQYDYIYVYFTAVEKPNSPYRYMPTDEIIITMICKEIDGVKKYPAYNEEYSTGRMGVRR